MKIVGIIAEYNPFHNGHQYHIKEALKISGADTAIVVMSGDFVQRGSPAIMPKHIRAEMALNGGASLVLELPVPYATGSAEYFAHGAISLLNKLGCVDSICFGSECGEIIKLEELAHILSEEPEEYRFLLSSYLKQGNSFPHARQLAIHDYLNSDSADEILSSPNNILGIEYLKALYRLHSKMKAYTIRRISSNYHDQELKETYSSASAIRNEIKRDSMDTLLSQVSETNLKLLRNLKNLRYPVYPNDFSLVLKYKLMQESKESLMKYADVSVELANRILNRLDEYKKLEQFCDLLKTKELTYSRISRALLHILLDIKSEDYRDITYARVLGFRKSHSEILSQIKQNASIPLVTKLAAFPDLEGLKLDIKTSNLYESVLTDKYQTDFQSEYTKSIVISHI